MIFEESEVDFGTLKQGEKKTHLFKFKNTGDADLIIEFASGSCGCTVPAWPEDTIKPGETGEILVEYDSKDKEGDESTEVNIIANTDPIVTVIKMKAKIIVE